MTDFFVAHLHCDVMGSSWSPGESSRVHGGYKGGWVGVHIGAGGVFANIENASTLRKAE